MTKRKQTQIERNAKRLGQLLTIEEAFGSPEIVPEVLFERAYLVCWLQRELRWAEVWQPAMWK